MAATHHIDNKNKLIITSWNGEPSATEFIETLRKYQTEIKSNSEYIDYDELLDLGEIKGFKISSDNLRMLGNIAAFSDKPGVHNKLAIVAESQLAYGLARMYEIYRSLNSNSNKTIRVFKDKPEAIAWVCKTNNQA